MTHSHHTYINSTRGLDCNREKNTSVLGVQSFATSVDARVYHMRDRDGRHEIDLIVEDPGGRVVALEVKLAATPDDHDVRHLLWLKQRMGAQLADMAVITTGRHAYRRPDGVAVIPAALLGP